MTTPNLDAEILRLTELRDQVRADRLQMMKENATSANFADKTINRFALCGLAQGRDRVRVSYQASARAEGR